MKDLHSEQGTTWSPTMPPSRRQIMGYGLGAVTGALLAGNSSAFAAGRSSSIIVETSDGKLGGITGDGVATFKGIPYGASTAGRNRFMVPQPVKRWTGVRDATRLGHPCVQSNPDYPDWNDPMPGSEDCLALNVWAPQGSSHGSKLPVVVWIHGGGYTFGSAGAPLYDLGNMARRGNIVGVGVNHRLQAFGFTDLGADAGSEFAGAGNAGVLDLVAALQWIRSNIERFGGDPANVTVFGESGGGAKLSTLMAMPVAKGLFHKAIIDSGSIFRYRERAEAEETTDRMFSLLGIHRKDFRALQEVPAPILVKCGDQIMRESKGTGHPSLKFAPVIDGHFLPTRAWTSAAPDGAANIPILLGTNRDETIIYLSDDARRGVTTDEEIAKAVVDSTPSYTPDSNRVAALIPFYRDRMPGASNFEIILQMSTDMTYWAGMVHQAELQVAAGAPVYSYRCDWRTPCFGAKYSPHGMDLPLVMGHRHYGTAWDGKDTDAQRAAADPENIRFKVGNQMLTAWTQFAKAGDPSTDDLQWPQYDLKERQTLVFGPETKLAQDPRGEFRKPLKTV